MTNHENNAPKGMMPWVMWGLATLFYCYEFFLQVSPSVMVKEIMQAFHVSAAQLGNLTAFYLYAYGIMQIPVGILLDRYGPRRLLTIATLFCAAGATLFGTTHSFPIAATGRFMIGFGSAFAAVSCMHIAATWLPIKRFALLVGVMLTIGMLGAICGQAPLSLLMGLIGWRQTLILFGAIGVMLSIVIYSVVRDRAITQTTEHHFDAPGFFSGIKHVIKNNQTWMAAIHAGLMFLPTPAFAGLWGVSFLMTAYGFHRTYAAFLISLIFAGWAVGSPTLGGWFSDFLQKRRPPMLIGSVGALICILFIIYVKMSVMLLGSLLFAFGFFSSGFLPAFSVSREVNPPQTNATALGFVNMLNTLGAAIAQPLIGLLLDLTTSSPVIKGSHHFTYSDYRVALVTLPICIALAILFIPLIKETHCKPNY